MTLFVDDQEKDNVRPDPDMVFQLVYNGWRAHILQIAIQLDVFTLIANGLNTIQKITSTLNWTHRPLQVLLDGLCPLFLSKKKGVYVLTPTSEAFLVRDRTTYAGDALRYFLSCDPWQHFIYGVKTGKLVIPDASSPAFSHLWIQDATMDSMRMERIEESIDMWRTVRIDPDAKQEINILDLASGCGIKSLTLAKKNPNAAITCIDWGGVLDVAKSLAERWGILDQAHSFTHRYNMDIVTGNLVRNQEISSGIPDSQGVPVWQNPQP